MTIRPIYIPDLDDDKFVSSKDVEFKWYPGFSISQKQKSITSLHENATKSLNLSKILEISTKSPTSLGVKCSAFNLMLEINGFKSSVESFYQGSKIFKNGGPYTDLYEMKSIISKKDKRIKESGELIGFSFFDTHWGLIEDFYSYLYILALNQNLSLANEIQKYTAFTDIEFNPKKSFNCQAYSAALFVAATNRNIDLEGLESKECFVDRFPSKELINFQNDLF